MNEADSTIAASVNEEFASIPSGMVAFLFTDIEGSTRLWESYTEAMPAALARHDAILRGAIENQNGYVFKTVGDSFYAVFHTMTDALNAALEAQLSLARENWEQIGAMRVRMGLHGGVCEERDGDYFGPPLNRVARLMSIAHGGQVVLSEVAQELTAANLPQKASLREMGSHFLKDLAQPELVWQLVYPDLPDSFPKLRSLPNAAKNHNLAVEVTSFVGREAEVGAIRRHLRNARVVTVTGAGGSGKSRIAQKVAAELLTEYDDGIWLVELAQLTEANQVTQSFASILGVREETGRPVLDTLIEHLKDKTVLFLLDNCEHLLSEAARVTDAIIRACSGVTFLSSSREPLGIGGEIIYQLPSLSLPESDAPLVSPQRLMQYEGIRLFVERASLLSPSFLMTEANAPAIVQICSRLDGIPLALELAAARVKALPVEQIAKRLDDSFRILTGGSRTALPHQQTLRALIDWSYNLLTDSEKILLRRLSVLTGVWTLEVAESICAGESANGESIEEWEILDLLAALVNKSLVVYREEDGQYRILETIRQYGRDRLNESGENEVIRECHAEFFLRYSQERLTKLRTPGETEALAALSSQSGNLRAAMEWAKNANRSTLFAELAMAVGITLQRYGYQTEAVAPIQAALDALQLEDAPNSVLSARLLRERAGLHLDLQETAEARNRIEEALVLFQQLEDQRGQAQSASLLGQITLTERAFAEARGYFQQALAEFDRVKDRTESANIRNNLGLLERRDENGSNQEAEVHHKEALRLYRLLGDKRGMMETLNNLGVLAEKNNNMEEAWEYYTETLHLSHDLRYTLGIAICFYNLAEIAKGRETKSGKQRAFRLYAAAESLFANLKSRHITVAAEGLNGLLKDAQLGYSEEVLAVIRTVVCDKSLDQLLSWSLEENTETTV